MSNKEELIRVIKNWIEADSIVKKLNKEIKQHRDTKK